MQTISIARTIVVAAAILGTGYVAAIAQTPGERDQDFGRNSASKRDEVQQAADHGDALAQERLAVMYATGQGVARDDQAAVVWWTRAANSGDAKAIWELGLEYVAGTRVGCDYNAAFAWFQRGADQGHAFSQEWLAHMLSGEYTGIARDDARAAYWYRQAADQGVPGAERCLGDLYAQGKGLQQDSRQAIFWWTRAAEKGDSEAQRELAATYFSGHGVPVDLPVAAHWYQMAANSGDGEAVVMLADMYRSGTGVPIDYQKAAALYLKSARRGWASAQLRLGDMYEVGQGVSKNLVIAFAWNEIVIERTVTPLDQKLELLMQQSLPPDALKAANESVAKESILASNNVARLSRSLAPAEIARAHQMVLAWQPGLAMDDTGVELKP